MDTRFDFKYDPQAEPAVAFCAHCGAEIYKHDIIYMFDNRMVHEDCLGEYAAEHCRKAEAIEVIEYG